MQLKRVAEAKLPTPLGDFLMVGFEELATGHDMPRWFLAIFQVKRQYWLAFIPNVLPGTRFLVLRCDCGFQLEAALTHIAEEGRGILIYHRQEGRISACLIKFALMRYRIKAMTRWRPIISSALPPMSVISPCARICSNYWAWMKFAC
ncbi:GTP cyclohydrolase II [Salmonella enterica subsp. enterica]|uniref:GTP cyclohydrolase II n=1 Tax=Salmonella enterica I TaxID=59201 RepID=A0A447PK41_SALET|nr:GTP cyclohydrolase II [Salmonella enterica subsp. enterica]